MVAFCCAVIARIFGRTGRSFGLGQDLPTKRQFAASAVRPSLAD